MKNLFILMVLIGLAACAEPVDDASSKPDRNPDTHMIDGRADQLTDYYTTIVGSLPLDGSNVEGEIDYPEWFHGYTLDLEAGQEIDFGLYAADEGYLRFYGPETGRTGDGNPVFGTALGGGMLNGGASFTFTVPTSGTYMLVYGPRYVWSTTYDFVATCTNCPEDQVACNGDFDCEADEFCGDNGVRCVTAPCTANFDVCQARNTDGAFCSRDRECAAGSICSNNFCETVPSCTEDRDCAQGFCGYDDQRNRICKPYAAEGTLCGGFVRPQDYYICPPDLSCNAPDFVADVGGTCGFSVTTEDLLLDPAEYDGRHIGITGYIKAGNGYCTRMACPVDNACCNRCGTGLQLVQSITDQATVELRDAATGENYGCTGDDCDMQRDCTVEPDARYFIAGKYVWDAQFQVGTIEVTRKFKGFEVIR